MSGAAGAWARVGDEAHAVLGPGARYEVRVAHGAGAAVRIAAPHGGVLALHAAPPPACTPGAWQVAAGCGDAAAWLLAPEPPAEPGAAAARLEAALAAAVALDARERSARATAAAAALLDDLTHALRTDLMSLLGVADGLAAGAFRPEETGELHDALAATGAGAHARLTAAREVGRTLTPPAEGVDLLELLDALEPGAEGERPRVLMRASAARACLEALQEHQLPGDGPLRVAPAPGGWAVGAGLAAPPASPLERGLAPAAWLVAAGGGAAHAEPSGTGVRVTLVLPAAVPALRAGGA